ncbi:MAG: molybdenum cofactor biosynthesis protein B [Proteobacteria bacterium]|nr:molybdenum cofactor biosynthesis protein B [Pseudomonadota bacterium]MCP4916414.1 molybdenum cofactor biosynthesis protein B [Pseudomonadota bacterium]
MSDMRPLRIAILTISDSRTLETDTSGATLIGRLEKAGHVLATREIVPDEQPIIEAQLRTWIADPRVEVVITTGGTGVTGRDITPEAVEAVCNKMIPGFGEQFRRVSLETIGLAAIQSRACAGLAETTYVFALPGSTGACKDGWDRILEEQLDSRTRPCNFASLIPRLDE